MSSCRLLTMRVFSFSRCLKILKCKSIVRKYHTSQIHPCKMKMVAHLLPEIEAQLEAEQYKHRKHPGMRNVKTIGLPEDLRKIIWKIIDDADIPNWKEERKEMANYIYSRRLPIEADELGQKTREAMQRMNLPEEVLYGDDKESKKLVGMLKNKLRCEVKRWKPIDYTTHKCLIYTLARFMENYACTYQVFSELVKAIPTFQPKTYFDFGSGVGSSLWAAQQFWGSSIEEHFLVDASAEMNNLCELILKGGNVEDPFLLKNVFFRQFLPVSGERKYDLVVSSFSMMDLPSAEERLKIIDVLWQKTNDILIFVENGSNAGFFTILEARDYILKLEEISGDKSNGVQVIAPCTHQMVCPKFGNSRFPCHFRVQFHPMYPKKNIDAVRQDFYTYVILRKGHEKINKAPWPRIVEPVMKRSKLARCRLCCEDGKIHEIIFTKGTYPKHTYRCAKKSELGDLLPVTISEKVSDSSVEINSDSESEDEKEDKLSHQEISSPESSRREL